MFCSFTQYLFCWHKMIFPSIVKLKRYNYLKSLQPLNISYHHTKIFLIQIFTSMLSNLWSLVLQEILSIELLFFSDPGTIYAIFVQHNETTIELTSIRPSTGWDFFSIDSTPNIQQSFVNETALSLPLRIYGLIPGSQYIFDISVTISSSCDYGTNHPSSVTIYSCTGRDLA